MTDLIPILLYHSVSPEASSRYRRYCVSRQQFVAHMRCIRDEGYTPLGVSALRDAIATGALLPHRPVVLSFDDGLRDFFEGGLPVLSELGFPATLYVVAGLVGRTATWLRDEGEADRPLMTWAQLREAATLGIECGAHGLRHLPLDVLPARAYEDEIVAPKAILEDGLGQAVRTFAYPYGYHTSAIKARVREAGYDSACAVRHAMSHPTDDPYAMARLIVTSDVSTSTLAHWLAGHRLAVATSGERLRTKAWRQFRRWRTAWQAKRPGAAPTDTEETP